MKIGLISYTHDYIRNIQRAIREFNDKNVDIAIHVGDFTDPITIESFKGVKLVCVLGNNDTDIPGLTSAFDKVMIVFNPSFSLLILVTKFGFGGNHVEFETSLVEASRL